MVFKTITFKWCCSRQYRRLTFNELSTHTLHGLQARFWRGSLNERAVSSHTELLGIFWQNIKTLWQSRTFLEVFLCLLCYLTAFSLFRLTFKRFFNAVNERKAESIWVQLVNSVIVAVRIWLSSVADGICDTVGNRFRLTKWKRRSMVVCNFLMIATNTSLRPRVFFLPPGWIPSSVSSMNGAAVKFGIFFVLVQWKCARLFLSQITVVWLEVCLRHKQEGSGADSPPLMMFHWGWSSNQSSAAWDFRHRLQIERGFRLDWKNHAMKC